MTAEERYNLITKRARELLTYNIGSILFMCFTPFLDILGNGLQDTDESFYVHDLKVYFLQNFVQLACPSDSIVSFNILAWSLTPGEDNSMIVTVISRCSALSLNSWMIS